MRTFLKLAHGISSLESFSFALRLLDHAALQAAFQTGDMDALRELLRVGLEVNPSTEAGMTLLHHAAAGNQPDVIEMLINEYPAKSNVTDNEGRTPLDVAIQMDSQDAAFVLENEEQ